MSESNRQKRIAGLLQEDLANELQAMLREAGRASVIISVSKVKVTVDLSLARVYVSVFPSEKGKDIVAELNDVKPSIRHRIAQLVRHQLRKMPDLHFYLDDTLDYIDRIDQAVKGGENPLENPDLLPKRKKS